MTSFMNYFRDNQLDFNDTELLQKNARFYNKNISIRN